MIQKSPRRSWFACGRVAACLALPALLHAQVKRPMTNDDLMRIRDVDGVALSPGGDRVLYTISAWEHADARGDTALGDKHERRSHIWIVPFAGGVARQLTSAERGESQPQWSPDGQHIAYLYQTPTAPLDLWPHWTLARVITGRGYRAAVYPDELSGFVGRAVAAALLTTVVLSVAWRTRKRAGAEARMDEEEGVEWVLGAILLLTPALHPWYALWLLPSAALGRRAAWLALAALVPLGYMPLVGWLNGDPWRDPIWTRALEHGACLVLLVIGLRFPAARPQASKLDHSVEPDRILA